MEPDTNAAASPSAGTAAAAAAAVGPAAMGGLPESAVAAAFASCNGSLLVELRTAVYMRPRPEPESAEQPPPDLPHAGPALGVAQWGLGRGGWGRRWWTDPLYRLTDAPGRPVPLRALPSPLTAEGGDWVVAETAAALLRRD